jgi:2'-5' RNA ligase
MKAAFAFLADREVHNLVRKLSWDIHGKYRTGIDICRLPHHVSLKQPFNIANLEDLEAYAIQFANSMDPLEIKLTELQLIEIPANEMQTGLLWMNTHETEALRGLHNRLHEELTARFGDVTAPFDGLEYHFHMTVAMGNQPLEIYQKAHHEFSNRLKDVQFTARELGLFIYDEHDEANASYIIYQILPLKS